MQAGTKKCTKCGETKAHAEFSRDKQRDSGIHPICKACKNAYYKANREWIQQQNVEYRNLNREKIRAHNKRCYERHFFRLTAQNLRGRANDPLSAKKADISRLWKKQRGRCALTGRKLVRETAVLDHIVPLVKGGGSSIDNLQWLHKDANYAKRDLLEVTFLQLCREIVEFQSRKGKAVVMI